MPHPAAIAVTFWTSGATCDLSTRAKLAALAALTFHGAVEHGRVCLPTLAWALEVTTTEAETALAELVARDLAEGTPAAGFALTAKLLAFTNRRTAARLTAPPH